MSGHGRAPKIGQPRETALLRGEWSAADGVGWQHGEVPMAPDGLMPASVEAWGLWFSAWYAAHWSLVDVPAIRHLVALYDQVERGEFTRASELRLGLDTWGISPKGQQDRRWIEPKPVVDKPVVSSGAAARARRLKSVG